MITIKAPASSANLGPGFDCLGISLDLYNTFDVETCDHDVLENVEERFNNSDNLFLRAYHYGMEKIGKEDGIHAIFHCDIPVSRGLGSSASMIVAGLCAASALHEDALTDNEIFQLAGTLEGHPDNAAPCYFGGLTASTIYQGHFVSHKLECNDNWFFTVFIPDFEVSTEEARAILPESYPRSVAAANGAYELFMSEGLRTGSLSLLQVGGRDAIHEPYRKQLIPGFDDLKQLTEKECNGVFLISGSGSTCLLISRKPVNAHVLSEIKKIPDHVWEVKELHPSNGTEIWGDNK
jgi:homoserine kinase